MSTATITPPLHATDGAGTEAIARPRMSNPMPVAFGLFAFALCMYAVRFIDVGPTTIVANSKSDAFVYALLVAGIAETVCGVLAIIRGQAYQGSVASTFGIWLIGFFLLLTVGVKDKAFTPDAVGWYALILIVPVAIFAVPEFVHRNVPLMIAFTTIIVLLLLLGLGFHDLNNDLVNAAVTKRPPSLSGVADMLKISAWMGLIAAAAIWYLMARDLYRITGIFGMSPPPYQAR
jgi:succinate-acetate transporter protein